MSDEASEKRNREDGWVEVGAASIVAMRKQSNTNSGHCRGTAGAQRDSCLGGPEKEGANSLEKLARIKDSERVQKGERGGKEKKT